MQSDRFWSAQSRRRFFELAGIGLAGGSAAFLAACGGDDDDEEAAGPEEDIAILNNAIELEHAAIAAYTEGVRQLRGEALELARRMNQQEEEHLETLTGVVESLGGTPARARSSYNFPSLSTEDDVLRFATDLEVTAIAAYVDATPKLSSGELRATAALLATSEAEHAAVLRGLQGQEQASAALVKGERKVRI